MSVPIRRVFGCVRCSCLWLRANTTKLVWLSLVSRCPDSLPGVLCIPSLLAQRVCRDAALCRQDVLQGEKQELQFIKLLKVTVIMEKKTKKNEDCFTKQSNFA